MKNKVIKVRALKPRSVIMQGMAWMYLPVDVYVDVVGSDYYQKLEEKGLVEIMSDSKVISKSSGESVSKDNPVIGSRHSEVSKPVKRKVIRRKKTQA